MRKIQFETFRNLEDSYFFNLLRKNEPSNVNFLEYRKYKVTIELVDEPKEVLIERLKAMKKETRSFDKTKRLREEIKRIS